MTRAYLALGSNLGDRAGHLQFAIDALHAAAEIELIDISSVYETAPVGGPEQDAFLNAVLVVETGLDPYALLAVVQQIEHDAHRVRVERWGPRTLDVDVLLYGEVRSDDPVLTLPHPRMWERGFVLAPLRDVAPDLVEAGRAWEGVSRTPVTLRFPWGNHSAPSP